MLKVALKGFWAKKGRYFLTAMAILLGVAFLTGVLTVSDTVRKSLDDLYTKLYSNVDVVVQGDTISKVEGGPQTLELRSYPPLDLAKTIADVPGVERVVPSFLFNAEISVMKTVKEDGKSVKRWTPVRDNNQQGAPQFGFGWNNDADLTQFKIAEGRAPKTSAEVVVDKSIASSNSIKIGQTISVRVLTTSEQYKVVGFARFGSADSAVVSTSAIFTQDHAQHLFQTTIGAGDGQRVNQFSVRGDGTDGRAALAAKIRTALKGQPVDVLTGDEAAQEQQDRVGSQLQFFTIFLIAFAVIAILVSVFIIYNSFAIIVAQRTRELALLRAIGARGSQIMWSVALEALMIGLLASGIGIAAGLGLAKLLLALFQSGGGGIPATALVLKPMTVVIALIVGLLVTAVSALVPAVHASRIPPIAALSVTAFERQRGLFVRSLLGVLALAVGVLVAVRAAWTEPDYDTVLAAVGLILVAGSAIMLLPILVKPLAFVLRSVVSRVRGVSAQIAADNAARSPRRTGRTASALMVGLTLVSFMVVAINSIQASFNKIIDQSVRGDLIIQDGNIQATQQTSQGFDPEILTLASEQKGVSLAVGIGTTVITLEREGAPILPVKTPTTAQSSEAAVPTAYVAGVADLKKLNDMTDYDVMAGSFAKADTDGVAMSTHLMSKLGLHMGDKVTLNFAREGVKATATIGARYEFRLFGDVYIAERTARAAGIPIAYTFGYVNLEPGVAEAPVQKKLQTSVRELAPSAKVSSLKQFKQQQADQINQFLQFLFVMLALALVIAVLGIVNTLSLAIFERQREIGLLRGVGMRRSQVRSMIRWEAVVMSIMGTVLGLGVGLLGAWAVMATLYSEDLKVFEIPTASLVWIVVVGAVFGVAASIVPAWRASRMNMLAAMASE